MKLLPIVATTTRVRLQPVVATPPSTFQLHLQPKQNYIKLGSIIPVRYPWPHDIMLNNVPPRFKSPQFQIPGATSRKSRGKKSPNTFNIRMETCRLQQKQPKGACLRWLSTFHWATVGETIEWFSSSRTVDGGAQEWKGHLPWSIEIEGLTAPWQKADGFLWRRSFHGERYIYRCMTVKCHTFRACGVWISTILRGFRYKSCRS